MMEKEYSMIEHLQGSKEAIGFLLYFLCEKNRDASPQVNTVLPNEGQINLIAAISNPILTKFTIKKFK